MEPDFFENLSKLFAPMPVSPLAAIWLEKPILTSKTVTKRITEGDYVFIENGELKDCIGEATHRITACFGTSNSDFSIHVINIKTLEISIVNL